MNQNRHPDRFAQIALEQADQRLASLVIPGAPELPERYLPMEETFTGNDLALPFHPLPQINTSELLQKQLVRFRRRFARYLRNVGPPLENTRFCLPIQEFE
jgi:hypothetical protein